MKSVIRIVSGGQTGVDRAALDAALELGVACGGWCPAGRLAEDGPIDKRYPLIETETEQYPERTRRNVVDSDATLIVYFDRLEGGTKKTQNYCLQYHKPCLLLDLAEQDLTTAAVILKRFILENSIKILNVAGPRASKQEQAYSVTKSLIKTTLGLLPA